MRWKGCAITIGKRSHGPTTGNIGNLQTPIMQLIWPNIMLKLNKILMCAIVILAEHSAIAGEAIFFNQGNLIAYRENGTVEGFYDSENEKFSCYFLFSQYPGDKSNSSGIGGYSSTKILTFVPGDVSLNFSARFKEFDIDGFIYRKGGDWVVKTTRPQAGCANAMGVFEFDPSQEGAESYYVSDTAPAIGIRLVNLKTGLFDLKDGKFSLRKGYLTKGDGVVVLKTYEQFSYVRYYNPHMNTRNAAKVTTGWIHSADLVNPFPPATKQ
nr:hypothetical protein [Paraburkholderia sp. J76]